MKRSRRKRGGGPPRDTSPNHAAQTRTPTDRPRHDGKAARPWLLPSLKAPAQAAATVLTLCVSLLGLWLSYNANNNANEANALAFKAMQLDKRAYISVKELRITKQGDGDDATWQFSPVVSNDGNSPARNLRYRFGSHIFLPPGQGLEQQQRGFAIATMVDALKPGAKYDRNLMRPKDPALMESAIDGAKLVLAGQTVSAAGILDVFRVSERFLKNQLASGMPYYVLGQFNYDDVLSPTDHHVTKFCYVIYRDSLQPDVGLRASEAQAFVPGAGLCDQWNCSDDECAHQAQ